MKPTRFIAFLIVLTLGGLVGGCGKEGPKHSESSTDDAHAEGHDDHDEEGGESSASFKAGTGLAFPPEVLAAMGVSTAEVEERLLPLTIDLFAQVYATLPSPRAVALVSPASAEPYQLGETLKLRLRIAPDTPRVTVPRAAVLDTALGTFVYVVNGEAFLRTPVTTGAMDDDTIEITDGVFEGDTVVISPVSQLWLTELRLTKGGGHSH
mgnify:CR=1 FL=1